MPTRDEVYWKFGKVSEDAQLLEIELGTMLIKHRYREAGLLEQDDPKKETEIQNDIKRMTLGRLLGHLRPLENFDEDLYQLLRHANDSRIRLFHFFHLDHNFRHNSEEGREVMLRDLEAIQVVLREALDALMLRSKEEYEKIVEELGDNPPPTGHLPL